jgi:hypothetical protein
MTYELKPTDAQGKAEEQQLRCRRCEADLDPEFEVDGFCDDHCKEEDEEDEQDDYWGDLYSIPDLSSDGNYWRRPR